MMQKKLTYDEWMKTLGSNTLERAALINQNTELSRRCFTLKCELTRTKRVLWLSRAERAKENVKYLKVMLRHTSPKSELFDPMVKFIACWNYTESKCRAYADKFKEDK